ncbi:dual 3',5'-cyclic-AMP and -GMP phosphodiesterase 11 [Caerostris extrusa]|uniref:Dual 3',5'-cyclic-AMP and -GMP phosphodiesterase 11 n=1 Tax=Caerostris extrusa TaxID=172846 RepID=A0AAV4XPL2_CAEEX|nr:dual 3',5'-cyclic-AMP and -GMP phosphodiesterase 11 [Caerostris extrusa]
MLCLPGQRIKIDPLTRNFSLCSRGKDLKYQLSSLEKFMTDCGSKILSEVQKSPLVCPTPRQKETWRNDPVRRKFSRFKGHPEDPLFRGLLTGCWRLCDLLDCKLSSQNIQVCKCLVSQLFDASRDSSRTSTTKRRNLYSGAPASQVTRPNIETLNIPDCYKDDRFNRLVDRRTGYKTYNMLCMPIMDTNGEVKGVAQIINKCRGEHPFTDVDEEVFSRYLRFCSIGIRNAELYERAELENKRNHVLLDLARMIFEEQSTIGQIIHRDNGSYPISSSG